MYHERQTTCWAMTKPNPHDFYMHVHAPSSNSDISIIAMYDIQTHKLPLIGVQRLYAIYNGICETCTRDDYISSITLHYKPYTYFLSCPKMIQI